MAERLQTPASEMDDLSRSVLYYSMEQAKDAMRIVADYISQHPRVHVKYHDDPNLGCFADLENQDLYIPVQGYASGLSEDGLWALRSSVTHEAGHIIETFFTGKLSWMDKEPGAKDMMKACMGAIGKKALHSIWNSIEDVRMETIIGDRYPGSKIALQKGREIAARRNEVLLAEAAEKNPEGRKRKALWEATYLCMTELQGIHTGIVPTPEARAILDIIHDDYVNGFRDVRSCNDSAELAKVLYDKLFEAMGDDVDKKDEEKSDTEKRKKLIIRISKRKDKQDGKGQQQQPDGDGKAKGGKRKGQDTGQGGQGETAEGGGTGSGSGTGVEGGCQAGSGNPGGEGKDAGGPMDAEGTPGEAAVGTEEGMPGMRVGEGAEEFEVILEIDEELLEDGKSMTDIMNELFVEEKRYVDPKECKYTAFRDNDVHTSPDSRRRDLLSAREARLREGIDGSTPSLIRCLEQALRTITRERTTRFQRHGRIDGSLLADIGKNLSRNVFTRKSEKWKLDTAVYLVVDESSSMSSVLDKAAQTVLSLGDAMTRLGIPFEITGTSTDKTRMDSSLSGVFTRYNAMSFVHYKTFAEPWNGTSWRLAAMDDRENNIDGEAIGFAAFRLSQRREKRKVIISICDGEPCSGQWGGTDHHMAWNLQNVCKRVRASGTEVYGFGIGTDGPARYYGEEHFFKLDKSGMSEGFFKKMAEILITGQIQMQANHDRG